MTCDDLKTFCKYFFIVFIYLNLLFVKLLAHSSDCCVVQNFDKGNFDSFRWFLTRQSKLHP